jgi:hypothetical protein
MKRKLFILFIVALLLIGSVLIPIESEHGNLNGRAFNQPLEKNIRRQVNENTQVEQTYENNYTTIRTHYNNAVAFWGCHCDIPTSFLGPL